MNKMVRCHPLVISLLLALACTAEQKAMNKRGCASIDETRCSNLLTRDVNSVELLPEEFRPKVDVYGNPTEVPGLKGSSLITQDRLISLETLKKNQDEPFFSYASPPGWEAEFSLPQTSGSCTDLSYSLSVPKFKDLEPKEGTYSICARLYNKNEGYVYIRTPPFVLVQNTGDVALWSKEFPTEYKPIRGKAGESLVLLRGYTPSLLILDNIITLSTIEKNRDQEIFNYRGPPGWDVSFSSPQLQIASDLASIEIDPQSGYEQLRYSPNEPTFSMLPVNEGGTYTTYIRLKNEELGVYYLKTPYVVVRSQTQGAGTGTIISDLGPTGTSLTINAESPTTPSLNVTLSLGATGASEMYITNTSDCITGGLWQTYASSSPWTLSQSNAIASVYVKFKNSAGNESSCINDTIVHDSQAPTETSISINAAATYATSTSATLSIAATGARDMYITNTAGCVSGGTWATYATSSAWILEQTNATATVYIKFKDGAGNESSCHSDTIIHDSEAPTATSISINSGATYATSTSATLALAATGASHMYITDTPGCASGGTWTTYAGSSAWTLGQSNATATVYIKYRDVAGNESSCINDTIIHDSQAPVAIGISVNAGATYATSTNATLTLTATDASDMYITDTPGCSSGGSWVTYATSSAWTLAQTNSTATVYIKYKDALGNESSCINDTIIHDTQAPTSTSISINAAAAYANSTSATLTLAAADASDMYITNTSGCASGGTWTPFATNSAWLLGQSNTTTTVYVKYKDAVGNESACINDTIIHDSQPPTSTSISINAAATYTASTSATLTLAATDASEMYITDDAGCASGGIWATYATSAAWTLAQTNATAIVYIKYRDAAANESSCINDTIIHDNQAPTSTSISIDAGATSASSTSVVLTLAATAASDMYITNTSGCGSGGTWETYATSSPWTLGQVNATATVYIKYKDAAGNESACINDTITQASPGPTGISISINAGATYTTTTAVSLALTATGAVDMYITNTSGCASGGAWEAFATSSPWSLGQTNGNATVYIKFRDGLNTETACLPETITHDNQAPTATSISINSAANYATSTSATLTLAATGASDMYITDTSGCGSGGAWETYATSTAWTLGQTNATATVYIKYKDAAGNESSCINDTIIHDTQAPTVTSISINSGASYATSTSATLTLAATGASDMYITDTAGCASGGTWATYATSSAWTLAQTNATATVYIKYKDAAGNESSCINDTIIHDSQAPTATSISINSGASYATSTSATLTLAATGASDMYITDTSGCASGGTWASYATSSAWTLAQTNATATVYIKYKDAAGNESSCINDTIIHDSQAPTATSISINSGASYATTTSATLTLAATGASDMYITDTSGCGSGGNWETYATSAAWTLAQTNTTATVYIKYKDAAGNEGGCINDTIIHDTQAPTGGSISISGGAAASAASSVTLGLAATDAAEMYITNTSGCAANGSWEAYSTTRAGWPLGQTNATATVYVKFRDGALNETTCLSDTIVHDSQPPTAPTAFNDGLSTPNAALSPTFTWSTATDSGSGIASYEIAIGTSAGATNVQGWTDVGNTLSASLNGLSFSRGTYYASIRSLDQAGNASAQADGDGFTFGLWSQQAYLKASNNDASDAFGSKLAISEDTVAVAALGESSNQTTITNGSTASTNNSNGSSGAVYIYKRSAVTWTQEAYLKPASNDASDNFGCSISLYSNNLAVGTCGDDSNQTTIINGTTVSTDNTKGDSGAVYVYVRTATNWGQEAYLKAVNSESGDQFGASVSLDSNTLAVGASAEDSGVTTITNGTTASADNSRDGSGAVYVYSRSAASWQQQAYLKAANNDAGKILGGTPYPDDGFGKQVALSSDTLAVGSPGEDSTQQTITNGTTASMDNTAEDPGAVYVYKRTATNWAQQAYIKGHNIYDFCGFGAQIGLSTDTLTVGVSFDSTNRGASYVFTRSAGNWVQEAYLYPSIGEVVDKFGGSVAVSGDTLAAGATGEDSNQTTITNGTTGSSDNTKSASGAAYVYQRSATTWTQDAYIKSPNAEADDQFGHTVALYSTTLVVGSVNEDSNQTTITNGSTASTNNSNASSGAVYIFTR